MILDSRPSDAIALALRADCPIYVDMEVIKASRNSCPQKKARSRQLVKKNVPDVIGEAATSRCDLQVSSVSVGINA